MWPHDPYHFPKTIRIVFHLDCMNWLKPKRVPMFRPQVRWDGIARINHHIWGIVRFGAQLLHHGFVLKRRFGRLREEGVYKLTLASTPIRCTIGCTVHYRLPTRLLPYRLSRPICYWPLPYISLFTWLTLGQTKFLVVSKPPISIKVRKSQLYIPKSQKQTKGNSSLVSMIILQ